MLVLLPPSETKRPGGCGEPHGEDLALSTPVLAAPRRRVREAVVAACRACPEEAAAGLKLPPAARADALAANAALRSAPTMPALDRYAGVLYDALDASTLSPAERACAEDAIVIFSGLWGWVRGADLVPSYRVPASAKVPGLGALTPLWRTALRQAVPGLLGADGFAVDLRSTDYAAMWKPTGPMRRQVLPVRILQERGSGRRRTARVVSFHSKQAKGRLSRALVEQAASGRPPASPADVAAVGESLGWRAETRTVTGGSAALDFLDPS